MMMSQSTRSGRTSWTFSIARRPLPTVTTSKSSSENVSSITFWMVMLSSASRIFLPIATQTSPDGCPNIDRGCPSVNDLSGLTIGEEQQMRAERDSLARSERGLRNGSLDELDHVLGRGPGQEHLGHPDPL